MVVDHPTKIHTMDGTYHFSHAVLIIAVLGRQPHISFTGAIRGHTYAVNASGNTDLETSCFIDCCIAELVQS